MKAAIAARHVLIQKAPERRGLLRGYSLKLSLKHAETHPLSLTRSQRKEEGDMKNLRREKHRTYLSHYLHRPTAR